MAEYVNFSAESDDDESEGLEKKSSSKSEKKASIFGASVLKSSETSAKKETPKKSEGLDRLLAELSFSKKEKAVEAPTAEQPAAAQAPEAAHQEPYGPEASIDPVAQESAVATNVENLDTPQAEEVAEQSSEVLEEAPQEADNSVAEAVDMPATVEANVEDDTEDTSPTTVYYRPVPTSSGRPTVVPPSPVPTPSSSTSSRTAQIPTIPAAQQATAHASTASNPNALNVPSTNAAAANIAPNAQEAIDDAEYYARTRGRREGVLAGMLLGGGIEHFRHKRRERKMEKDFTKKEKAHEKDLENLTYEQKREAMVKDLREAYEQRYQEKAEASASAAVPTQAEALGGAQAAASTERGKTVSPQEVIELPRDHHIESSAWLNVEVDAQGNPVENSSFEYGAEYYRERAHEVRAEDDHDDDTKPKQPSTPDQKSQQASPTMFAGSTLASAPPASVGQQLPPSTVSTVSTPQRVVRAVTTPPTTPLGTTIWSAALVIILVIIAVVIL